MTAATWHIPRISGDPLRIAVDQGEVMLIVGSNGSGKSALSYWLARSHSERPVRRILAQRQVWLSSAAPDVTYGRRGLLAQSIEREDAKPSSRTQDLMGSDRVSTLLFDVLASVNERNAIVADGVDEGSFTPSELAEIGPSLLRRISELMQLSGIPLSFKSGAKNTVEARRESEVYPISDMSDGEKSAFLLAAEVLLAPAGSILLIDEPERHMHRAISAGFVTALIAARNDCSFILLTHDLDLISLGFRTLFVESVSWVRGEVVGWELEEFEANSDREDRVRLAVLGGRARVLFVEGEVLSLDKPLYEILFPEWSVQAVGGSEQVSRVVAGMKDASRRHWIDVAGVIDGDCWNQEEKEEFTRKGVLVLPVNEVENLYYLPFIVEYQARVQSEALGEPAGGRLIVARDNAMGSLVKEGVMENLAAENAVKIIRHEALRGLPSKQDVRIPSVSWEMRSPWEKELEALRQAVRDSAHEAVVERYSIRESGYRQYIAEGLGYRSPKDYQAAVRVSLTKNPDLLGRLRDMVGHL